MSKIIAQTSLQILRQPGRLFTPCNNIHTSSLLFAQPMKKKRRIDPAVLKVRVERKIKKYEREINKLESEPRQLIPILEYQLSRADIKDLESRPGRSLADAGTNEAEFKAASRLWSFYCAEHHRKFKQSITRVEKAQTHALECLKELDEGLYKKTVELDECCLIPFRSSHMRKETPANPNYKCPDGSVKDVTKDWII